MVYDPSDLEINEDVFNNKYWTPSEFENLQGEELPGNMPQTRGLGLQMRSKVDADHEADTVTRRSRTGFSGIAEQ